MEPVSEATSHYQFYTICNLDEIFEELIDSGIPADTMTRPTSVPNTFPTSPTPAFPSLPSPHVNKAFTPSSGRAFTPNSGCQADAESQLHIIDQVLHHDKSTYLLLNNSNIRDKPTREAVKQENAKNPSQYGKPKDELEYNRKPPHLAVLPSPS
eukprot:3969316-Ditylum_brightwellii.AAC.1